MKVLCKCGKFYLSEGMSCPVCGHALTVTEAADALEAQEAYQRGAKERQRKGMSEWPKDKAVKEELRRREQERKDADKRPVSAVLIGTADHRSALGTVTRAMVGGAFFGIAGALGGAASGTSQVTHATFSVMYASGRTGTETVKVGSQRFRELSALLHK